jgi:hypothetical protein
MKSTVYRMLEKQRVSQLQQRKRMMQTVSVDRSTTTRRDTLCKSVMVEDSVFWGGGLSVNEPLDSRKRRVKEIEEGIKQKLPSLKGKKKTIL